MTCSQFQRVLCAREQIDHEAKAKPIYIYMTLSSHGFSLYQQIYQAFSVVAKATPVLWQPVISGTASA